MASADIDEDWRLEDLVDFESLVLDDEALVDESINVKTLENRDRAIYKQAIAPSDPDGTMGNRQLLRIWLESRRTERRDAGEELPGDGFHQAYYLLLQVLGVLGLVFGASYAGAHLQYFGDRPINTFVFFLIVPAQVAVLVLVALHGPITKAFGCFKGLAAIRGLFGRLYSSVARRPARGTSWGNDAAVRSAWHGYRKTKQLGPILDRLERTLSWICQRRERLASASMQKRATFGAALNRIRGRMSIYGTVFLWPLLTLTQVFVVCFNLAVIVAVLLMVTFTNRGFGWESTLDIGPAAVHRTVKCIALPWAWLPDACPTLEQVQGSRIPVHGAAQHEYPPGALAAWWPFLCYAVFFYGFLPRAAILLLARVKEARTLAALQFNDSDCNAIVRRLRPVIESVPEPVLANELHEDTALGEPLPSHGTHVITIIARDALFADGAIDSALRHLGFLEKNRVNANAFPDDKALAGPIGEADWQGAQPQLVVALDAAQSPTDEHRFFLDQLRSIAGREALITVLLLPCAQSRKDYFPYWKEMIARMRDPYLDCKSFARHA